MIKTTQIRILSVGQFAISLAHVIRLYLPTITSSDYKEVGDMLKERPPSAEMYVFITPAPSRENCIAVSRYCSANSLNFLPVTVHMDSLWIGPLSNGGKGACWYCAMMRYHHRVHPSRQHSGSTIATVPGKLLPLIASGVWHSIDLMKLQRLPAGYVWRMDLQSYQVQRHEVVKFHGCESCALNENGANTVSASMKDALSFLHSKPEI